MAENIKCRTPLEDFIPQVPEWHGKYVQDRCALKVEAFIQRKWDSPCLRESSCKEEYLWVENRIEELKRKEDLDRLEDDIEVVYRWGGGLGPMIFAQIMKNNLPVDKVREQAKAAFSALGEGYPVEALEQLKRLKHCGDAFGSKVLAMRSPKNAPIWDNIAQICLSEFKIGGKKVRIYEQFITFCKHIADELKRQGIPCPLGCDGSPREVEGRWYLRDIEMAIFQFGWDNDKFGGRITGELPLSRL